MKKFTVTNREMPRAGRLDSDHELPVFHHELHPFSHTCLESEGPTGCFGRSTYYFYRMKRLLFLLCVITSPACSQPVDSIPLNTIPPKSNFRSGVMLEMNYGYTYTRLPAIQAFFKANQVERDGNLDQVIMSGLRVPTKPLQRHMIHTSFRH